MARRRTRIVAAIDRAAHRGGHRDTVLTEGVHVSWTDSAMNRQTRVWSA